MKRYHIISTLLTLLFSLSTAASFSFNVEIECYPESASCVSESPDLGWLEDAKDGNDLELLSFDAFDSTFSRSKPTLFSGFYSQIENLPHSRSQIRAPPPLL